MQVSSAPSQTLDSHPLYTALSLDEKYEVSTQLLTTIQNTSDHPLLKAAMATLGKMFTDNTWAVQSIFKGQGRIRREITSLIEQGIPSERLSVLLKDIHKKKITAQLTEIKKMAPNWPQLTGLEGEIALGKLASAALKIQDEGEWGVIKRISKEAAELKKNISALVIFDPTLKGKYQPTLNDIATCHENVKAYRLKMLPSLIPDMIWSAFKDVLPFWGGNFKSDALLTIVVGLVYQYTGLFATIGFWPPLIIAGVIIRLNIIKLPSGPYMPEIARIDLLIEAGRTVILTLSLEYLMMNFFPAAAIGFTLLVPLLAVNFVLTAWALYSDNLLLKKIGNSELSSSSKFWQFAKIAHTLAKGVAPLGMLLVNMAMVFTNIAFLCEYLPMVLRHHWHALSNNYADWNIKFYFTGEKISQYSLKTWFFILELKRLLVPSQKNPPIQNMGTKSAFWGAVSLLLVQYGIGVAITLPLNLAMGVSLYGVMLGVFAAVSASFLMYFTYQSWHGTANERDTVNSSAHQNKVSTILKTFSALYEAEERCLEETEKSCYKTAILFTKPAAENSEIWSDGPSARYLSYFEEALNRELSDQENPQAVARDAISEIAMTRYKYQDDREQRLIEHPVLEILQTLKAKPAPA